MTRHVLGFVCMILVGVLPAVGCSDGGGQAGEGGAGGMGGTGGVGGIGGTAGEGGSGGMGGTGGVGGIGGTAGEGGSGGMGGAGGVGGIGGTAGEGGSGGTTGEVFPCTEQGIRDAIAVGGGPHTFACDGPMTVVTKAEIVIENDVILDGEGNLTVDGDEDHRVFSVAESITAELRGFRVTRGFDYLDGGGVRSSGTLTLTNSSVSGSAADIGGGIYNDGRLTLINSTVSGNIAEDYGGGGIYNGDSLDAVDSSVSGNTANLGGGIVNADRGVARFTNVTVSGNVAEIGGGIHNDGLMILANSTVSTNVAYDGGGIRSYNGYMILINTTLSENAANFRGSGISGGGLSLINSLIANDCAGVSLSEGGNIESPGSTCIQLWQLQPTDQVNVSAEDLKLGPLADNGGPTETHALLPGSVAIDRIPEVDCVDADGARLTTDQRGVARPQGNACDVGAFELEVEP